MILSLLDNDLYKMTMMQAVWQRYRHGKATYELINRQQGNLFTESFCDQLRDELSLFSKLGFRSDERDWLENTGLFRKEFIEFLTSFKLDPSKINLRLSRNLSLEIEISGLWVETILWEVPLMALINEIYFNKIRKEWDRNLDHYRERSTEKGNELAQAGCHFSDFGTRRRRSLAVHQTVIDAFTKLKEGQKGCFLGTSNMYLAREFGITPIGTMAHEWIIAHAGIYGISGANRKALQVWRNVYENKLLIALTDTYTTELFLKEFSGPLARQYEGVRHDSGNPFSFAQNVISFYRREGIDPSTKTAVFSDNLTVERAIAIQRGVGGNIQPFFGIGNHFTNDFPGSPALDIVIKMTRINGRPVTKISDNPHKASGLPKAIEESLATIKRELARSRTNAPP